MKAFIIGQQRTGSTLLYEFIDSHPGIFCADELFILAPKPQWDYRFRMLKIYSWYYKKNRWSVQQYLNWVWSLSEHACIKILYHQVEHFNMQSTVFSLPAIHIVRKNYLKRTVSLFHTTARIKHKKPEEYIRDIQSAKHRDELWGRALEEKCPKYLRLSFEDLVGRNEVVRQTNYTFCREETGQKICKLFGMPYFEMFTSTQKKLKKKNYWKYIPEQFRDELRKRLMVEFPKEVWNG